MKCYRLKCVLALVVSLLLLFVGLPAHAEDEDITDAGDYLQIILPTIAGVSTLFAGNPEGGLVDKEGFYQFSKSLGASLATMGVGKGISGKLRPDASDRSSHPSGHTTAAFAGAGFIDQRYGHAWGIPSLLAAGFVGYSRVQADKHFADDVTAGASIGMMYNWLFVTPQSESNSFSMMPLMVDGGYGLAFNITDGFKKSDEAEPTFLRSPKFRYDFIFGPAYLNKNEIKSSSDNGTSFNLANFDKIDDPTSTAAIDIGYFMDDRNSFSLYFSPYESRDQGQFDTPVSFDGKLFPANTTINSDWVFYELRVGWQHNLTPDSPWDLKLGGGLSYQYLKTSLETADDSVSAEVIENLFLPLVSAKVSYHFTPRFSASIQAEGMYLSYESSLEAGASLNYRLTEHWDITAGYTYWQRNIDTSDIKNDAVYNVPFIAVAFSWL